MSRQTHLASTTMPTPLVPRGQLMRSGISTDTAAILVPQLFEFSTGTDVSGPGGLSYLFLGPKK